MAVLPVHRYLAVGRRLVAQGVESVRRDQAGTIRSESIRTHPDR